MTVPTELRLAEKILSKTIQDLEEAKALLDVVARMDPTTYVGGQHEIIRDLLPSLKEWLKQASVTV